MSEMNNDKTPVERNDTDYARYLAYQETIKLLRRNADGSR